MKNWILAIALFFTLHTHAQEVTWTGMKMDKLIAIREQDFQFAMLYILGSVDVLEGQGQYRS